MEESAKHLKLETFISIFDCKAIVFIARRLHELFYWSLMYHFCHVCSCA